MSMHYLFVPVELCAFAISKKFIRPTQLFLYLKCISSGKIKLERGAMKDIAHALGLKSSRAVRNNLNILLNSNWIGFNPASGYFFIRGFEAISMMNGFKSRTGAEFSVKDIKKFKGFAAGAVICCYVNQQKKRAWVAEQHKGGSRQTTHQPVFYPVANGALAKILHVSISTAFGYKKHASKDRFIKLKKNFTATGVLAEHLHVFKKASPEIAHRVRIHRKKLVIQDSDTVLPLIRFRSRKKTETLIKGDSKGSEFRLI